MTAVVKIQVLVSAKKKYPSAGYKEYIYMIRFYIQILEDKNELNIQFSLFFFFFFPLSCPSNAWNILADLEKA